MDIPWIFHVFFPHSMKHFIISSIQLQPVFRVTRPLEVKPTAAQSGAGAWSSHAGLLRWKGPAGDFQGLVTFGES